MPSELESGVPLRRTSAIEPAAAQARSSQTSERTVVPSEATRQTAMPSTLEGGQPISGAPLRVGPFTAGVVLQPMRGPSPARARRASAARGRAAAARDGRD